MQGVSSDQVLQMPITGRPSNRSAGKALVLHPAAVEKAVLVRMAEPGGAAVGLGVGHRCCSLTMRVGTIRAGGVARPCSAPAPVRASRTTRQFGGCRQAPGHLIRQLVARPRRLGPDPIEDRPNRGGQAPRPHALGPGEDRLLLQQQRRRDQPCHSTRCHRLEQPARRTPGAAHGDDDIGIEHTSHSCVVGDFTGCWVGRAEGGRGMDGLIVRIGLEGVSAGRPAGASWQRGAHDTRYCCHKGRSSPNPLIARSISA